MSVVKKILAILSGGIIGLGLLYLLCMETESKTQSQLFDDNKGRKSISFILGVDNGKSDYYKNATHHFVFNQEEKSDLVVQSCRTLGCVIEYLNQSQEREGRPWSVVNVVVHGNPNTGLNLFLFDKGPKATPKRLVQAVIEQSLPSLDKSVVDSTTHINFWSCGIGKNPLINMSLKNLFQPKDGDSVAVYCSPHFVIFQPSRIDGSPKRLRLSYWPFYYKRGYRPSPSEISLAMEQQYPDDSLQWQKALDSEAMENTDAFHQEYHIPISYTRVYLSKEARPDLYNDEQKMAWLDAQEEIQRQLEESNIPRDKFNWQVRKIIHTEKDGEKVPAVKAIGMCTVLAFLQEQPLL